MNHNILRSILAVFLTLSLQTVSACGGGSVSDGGGGGKGTQIATPQIATSAAQSGAQIITLTDSTAGAAIYFTLDGSAPTASSPQYMAPFLVVSSVTLKAIAIASGSSSDIASQTFSADIPSGTLVWSDEFANSTSANIAPNASVWTYDTGSGGWGNQELETYCAWNSSSSPCDAGNPNVYVGTDGYLHIVARQPSSGVYTSARLKTQGLFSLAYGRLEARMQLPEGQGLWPAFWTLGNNIAKVNWPACGEQDIMEHINAPQPDWVAGSIHGTNLNMSQQFSGGPGQSFSVSDWHTYGVIWSPNTVEFYVDAPTNVYATFTKAGAAGQAGAVWPFDNGSGAYILLNLAVGGAWPGSPNASTPFPSQVLVDYVRIYKN